MEGYGARIVEAKWLDDLLKNCQWHWQMLLLYMRAMESYIKNLLDYWSFKSYGQWSHKTSGTYLDEFLPRSSYERHVLNYFLIFISDRLEVLLHILPMCFNSCIHITVFFTGLDFIHIIQFNCWKLWCMTQLMLCKNPWNSTMIFLLVLFFHKRNLCFCAICYHYGGVSITVLLLLAFQLSELLQ